LQIDFQRASVMIRLRVPFHRFHDERGCVFFGASRAEFSDIRSRLAGSPVNSRIFRREQIAREIGLLQNNAGLGGGRKSRRCRVW